MLWYHYSMNSTTEKHNTSQTGFVEKHEGCFNEIRQRLSFFEFSRIVEICGITEILRNFSVTHLTDEELEKFSELQGYFQDLECRCLEEAGFE